MAAGPACTDCVVSVLLGPPGTGSGDVDAGWADRVDVADEHAQALAVLAGSGLVPPLRLVPRSVAS